MAALIPAMSELAIGLSDTSLAASDLDSKQSSSMEMCISSAAVILPLSTQKKPAIFNIPPELRLKIYGYVFKKRTWYRKTMTRPVNYFSTPTNNAQVLRTCKQFYDETLPVLYENTTFQTTSVTYLTSTLGMIGPRGMSFFTTIELDIFYPFTFEDCDALLPCQGLRTLRLMYDSHYDPRLQADELFHYTSEILDDNPFGDMECDIYALLPSAGFVDQMFSQHEDLKIVFTLDLYTVVSYEEYYEGMVTYQVTRSDVTETGSSISLVFVKSGVELHRYAENDSEATTDLNVDRGRYYDGSERYSWDDILRDIINRRNAAQQSASAQGNVVNNGAPSALQMASVLWQV
ncbi:hypothetical protein EJ08DRAFT_665399 [Tothia fuscella]|uniref:F-box domain-containing protein n=1 Tax=Tothia fuscella TaxID=1048955 RepID=A0A9P4NGS3_9PEZI|nr:hypothetical protein EJ08DRAFT_665399 [Tothia fuscella]